MFVAFPRNVRICAVVSHAKTNLFVWLNAVFCGLFDLGGGVLGRGLPPGPIALGDFAGPDSALAVTMPCAAKHMRNKNSRVSGYRSCVFRMICMLVLFERSESTLTPTLCCLVGARAASEAMTTMVVLYSRISSLTSISLRLYLVYQGHGTPHECNETGRI